MRNFKALRGEAEAGVVGWKETLNTLKRKTS
jgi:hypothetical protein